MKKFIFPFALLFSFTLFYSCSSDDNSTKTGGVDDYDDHALFGNWFPTTIKASAAGVADFEEDYPHKENCDADYLRVTETETIFFMHDDDCVKDNFSSPYEYGNDNLNFNILGYDVNLAIVKQTPSELILEGSGLEIAPLIPILLPDYADSIPPALLALVKVRITLVREL